MFDYNQKHATAYCISDAVAEIESRTDSCFANLGHCDIECHLCPLSLSSFETGMLLLFKTMTALEVYSILGYKTGDLGD